MTPDLDAIRAALTAATPDVAAYDFTSSYYAGQSILANAPVWLAELCDEIERLRADLCSLTQETELEREQWRSSMTIRSQHIASLRRHHDELQVVRTERDAALTEIERLQGIFQDTNRLLQDISADVVAWRACADQLGSAVWLDERREALAVYERLKLGG